MHLGALRNPAAIEGLRAARSRSSPPPISWSRSVATWIGGCSISACPPTGIVTIHDWSDGRVVHPLDRPSALRERSGWGDRFVVMHSGNVGLSQDLDTVIAAADLLRHEPDVLFAIVGEGASKASLQAEVDARGLTNVVFLPFQSREDLSESLGAADLHLVGLRRGPRRSDRAEQGLRHPRCGQAVPGGGRARSGAALIAEEYGCGMRVEPGDPPGARRRGARDARRGPRHHGQAWARGAGDPVRPLVRGRSVRSGSATGRGGARR